MKYLTRIIGVFIVNLGFDPRRLISSIRFIPEYFYGAFKLLTSKSDTKFKIKFLPILSDKHMSSGVATGHYFHQDLWAARRIYENKPVRHIDVGSRVDGFIAHLLVFREVEVLDVRKLQSSVKGLKFTQMNLMTSSEKDDFISDSVSCLHALEHFGLGRYGDPININGWQHGFMNLSKMLAPGGRLYISVPIGIQAIEFNAHRIFDPRTIINAAKEFDLELLEYSYIDDAGDFHESATVERSLGLIFGCGCFLFERNNDEIIN